MPPLPPLPGLPEDQGPAPGLPTGLSLAQKTEIMRRYGLPVPQWPRQPGDETRNLSKPEMDLLTEGDEKTVLPPTPSAPNPDIPSPLNSPQPRGGLAGLAVGIPTEWPRLPAGSSWPERSQAPTPSRPQTPPPPALAAPVAAPAPAPAVAQPGTPPGLPSTRPDEARMGAILDEVQQGGPWMGYRKREGLLGELGRGMGMPIPSPEEYAAFGNEQFQKERADLAGQREQLLAKGPGAGLMPSIEQQREYARLGLLESEPPDFLKPQVMIQTIKGTQLGQVPVYGSDYYAAQTPGTWQEKAVGEQAARRQALSVALHGLPEMAKLQEASLHVQAQRELAHKQMIERYFADPKNANASAQQFENYMEKVSSADQIAREKAPGVGVPGPAPQPFVGPLPEGQPSLPGKESSGQARLQRAAEEGHKLAATTPTEEGVQRALAKVSTLQDIDDLLKNLAGEQLVMSHAPSAQRVAQAVLNQGKNSDPVFRQGLAKAIIRHARLGGLVNPVGTEGQWKLGDARIDFEHRPGNDWFQLTSPSGRAYAAQHPSWLPFAGKVAGLDELLPEWTPLARERRLSYAKAGNQLLQAMEPLP